MVVSPIAMCLLTSRAVRAMSRELMSDKFQSNMASLTQSLGGSRTGQTSRSPVVHRLSRNMELTTSDSDLIVDKKPSAQVPLTTAKPMVVILPWLMAKPKHVARYAEYYIEQGFDVLTAYTNPLDVMWPTRGTKVVARDLVDFLHVNTLYQPLVLHGFSAGGYLWGETSLKLSENLEMYQHILDRFRGQVWDSVAEFTRSAAGFPLALFPRNLLMQFITRLFMKFYMYVFHNLVTVHYIKASEMFHANITKAPALFLLSKADPVATVDSVAIARRTWEARGLQTYWKVWDRSPHVGHFRYHPEEYVEELRLFLENIGLLVNSTEFQSNL